MATVPRLQAYEIMVFGYDRRQLQRMEFLFLIRAPGSPHIAVRFLNENGIDSLEHGLVEYRLAEFGNGSAVIVFHFHCLGHEAWVNSGGSFAQVEGTYRDDISCIVVYLSATVAALKERHTCKGGAPSAEQP